MKSILTSIILFASLTTFAVAEELAKGTFEGKSKHVTTGTATIVKTDDGFEIVLGEDFSLDNAPTPRVGLGKDGYDKETDSGALKNLKGAQTYPLAEGIDPANYNEVWIWCKRFNIPLGVAKLTKAE